MKGQPKILIVAFPGQGLINPSLRFANRLIKMGVDVTFCTGYSIIQRFDKNTTPHGLTFAPFSDGQDDGQQPTNILQQYFSDVATNGAQVVTELINSTDASSQSFDNLVYTTLVPWAAMVANAHGVRSTLLWCQPATVLDIYYYYYNGYESLISSSNMINNPTFAIHLPGLPPLTISDLPSFISPSRSIEQDFRVQLFKDHIDALKIYPRVLVNTFIDLEFASIKAIGKLELLPIGPLIPSEVLDVKDSSLGRDFFEKQNDDHCIEWLNTKPKLSVVYVSFGSVASFCMEQVEEIATGLLESGLPFLWVIRDSEQAIRLSKKDDLQKQGMIVRWCSQVVVLSHQAIGCFVMHGGWNSTMEAMVAGIPMVVFAQWSDQETIAKMVKDVWKIGVRVKRREGDGVVEGKEIERCVEMVINDGEMRRNAKKLRDLARDALKDGGSSIVNLQSFLDDI